MGHLVEARRVSKRTLYSIFAGRDVQVDVTPLSEGVVEDQGPVLDGSVRPGARRNQS